jgi:hypothetical protein
VRYFHSKGISQAAATSLALAATAFIVVFALATQLPSTLVIQRAGVEQAGEAEEAAGIRLSLVALLPDGYAVIANDGTRPVTLNRLFTPGGIMVLNPPITIQPGQKVSINVGNAEALAAGVEGSGNLKVVLKEKPGLQLATATTFTSCCVTTRYVLTRSSTITTTTYTPPTISITETQISLITNRPTSTVTNRITYCRTNYYGTYYTTYQSYYYAMSAILQTLTSTHTATQSLRITTSTTTSLVSTVNPWTLYYLTYVISILQPVAVTTITTTNTATLPTYIRTTQTTSLERCWGATNTLATIITQSATTVTGSVTYTTVTTATVS